MEQISLSYEVKEYINDKIGKKERIQVIEELLTHNYPQPIHLELLDLLYSHKMLEYLKEHYPVSGNKRRDTRLLRELDTELEQLKSERDTIDLEIGVLEKVIAPYYDAVDKQVDAIGEVETKPKRSKKQKNIEVIVPPSLIVE